MCDQAMSKPRKQQDKRGNHPQVIILNEQQTLLDHRLSEEFPEADRQYIVAIQEEFAQDLTELVVAAYAKVFDLLQRSLA